MKEPRIIEPKSHQGTLIEFQTSHRVYDRMILLSKAMARDLEDLDAPSIPPISHKAVSTDSVQIVQLLITEMIPVRKTNRHNLRNFPPFS